MAYFKFTFDSIYFCGFSETLYIEADSELEAEQSDKVDCMSDHMYDWISSFCDSDDEEDVEEVEDEDFTAHTYEIQEVEKEEYDEFVEFNVF